MRNQVMQNEVQSKRFFVSKSQNTTTAKWDLTIFYLQKQRLSIFPNSSVPLRNFILQTHTFFKNSVRKLS